MSRANSEPVELRALLPGAAGAGDLLVTDIETNSARCVAGGLFLACAGLRSHGLDYLDAALAAGVAAVAWEPAADRGAPDLPQDVAGFEVPNLSRELGVIADRFFGRPSRALRIAGVTGTNGKTTTAWLAAHALTSLGRPAAYMGTLGYGMGAALAHSELTTPDCVTVHRRLRALHDAGAQYVIMEVSSHALDQGRVDGVAFDVAALTNLSRDHLDYHRDMEHYGATKLRLFRKTGIETAVINIGDEWGGRFARECTAADVLSVALVAAATRSDARLAGELAGAGADGIRLRVRGGFGEAQVDSPLWGRFNAENLIVAVGLLLALGCGLADAAKALRHGTAPPGRMELIRGARSRPTVVVDYAHTPDALGQALAAVREHVRGAVWCVFGCGGDRDRGKRAEMGAIVTRLADHAIVTDDNPRGEDPRAIVDDILAGATRRVEVIHDRGDAIASAIRSAGANDAVLIAGKGHESVQRIGACTRAFSDAGAARAALGRVA